jgi:hypothetical protein
MSRQKADVKTTLLCATRLWSLGWREKDNSTPTLSRGVRYVMRRQGFSPAEISRAERELVREGKLEISGRKSGKALRLTDKGNAVSCARVALAPWTDDEYTGTQLGRGKRRR